MTSVQPINYKALIVKYIFNVVFFALLYALISFLLLSIKITGFTASVVAIAASGFGMMYLMKKIGPWIDKRLEK